jgi:PAS domain S-box-containing protein
MAAKVRSGDAAPVFLAGGGEMGARMRAHDWSASPLGSPAQWAQPLKTLTGVMLASSQPMIVAWGPSRTMLYNDGYAEILGLKHPGALGQPIDQVWSEIWDELEPIMTRCYAGEPIQMDDITLVMHRHGYAEEAHFAFSYTPVRDEAGWVAGVFCPCIEITARVLADRRCAFRLELEERLRGLSDAKEAMAAAAEALGRALDAAQVGYTEVGSDGHATTGEEFQDGRMPGLSAGRYHLQDYGPAMAADMAAGRVVAVHDVRKDPRTSSPDALAAYAESSLRAFIVVPLVKRGRLTAYLYAAHPEPRRWSDDDLALASEVAERTWAAVEWARAEAGLRGSEARFRLMADTVPQIIWITDAGGRVEFFNRQWTDYTGAHYEPTTAAEVAASFVHPADAALTMERFEEARRTESTFLVEHRIRSKEGDYRWFLVRGELYRDPSTGEIVRWFGASVDIHDRRRAEAALRESEARWRAIFQNMHEGFALCEMVYGPDGKATDFRYLELNTAWEQLTGIPVSETLGRTAKETFDNYEEFWIEKTAAVVETGEPVHLEYQIASIGRWYEVFAYRTEPGRFAALFLDVTQRKVDEERQALLAHEVDHRAKNALAVMQSALRLTTAPDLPSYIQAIEGRVGSLARAQTLLAADQWAGADLRMLLQGELAMFLGAGGGDGLRAELKGPTVALPVEMAQPLAMAMHELATNALKYGALSVPTGCLVVAWWLDSGPSGTLCLCWTETGGPPVVGAPKRRGFGSRLLARPIHRTAAAAGSVV